MYYFITMEQVKEGDNSSVNTGVDDADMNIFELVEEEEAKAEEYNCHQFRNGAADVNIDHACCRSELDLYMCSDGLAFVKTIGSKTVHNDPLQWWKKNQASYPILATRLAKIYLPVELTSAPSELVFSHTASLLSCLDPEYTEKAFFVSKHWEWFEKHQVNLAEIEMAEADGEDAYDE